jgi:hypothetical protein
MIGCKGATEMGGYQKARDPAAGLTASARKNPMAMKPPGFKLFIGLQSD